MGFTLCHCAQPSHPTRISMDGEEQGFLRMEMAALATLVRVAIDTPVQGWPQAFRKRGHTAPTVYAWSPILGPAGQRSSSLQRSRVRKRHTG